MADAYFTVAEFRDRYGDSDLTEAEYPDAAVDEMRLTAEEAFEDACGRAFVPRVETVVASANGGVFLALPRGRIRRVVSATLPDSSTLDVTGTAPYGSSSVYRPGGWPRGIGQLTVEFEHGETTPPRRVKQAVMLLTRVWLVRGPVDDRATQIPTEAGGTINLATPGLLGATFGIPEVDAVAHQYRLPTGLT